MSVLGLRFCEINVPKNVTYNPVRFIYQYGFFYFTMNFLTGATYTMERLIARKIRYVRNALDPNLHKEFTGFRVHLIKLFMYIFRSNIYILINIS